MITQSDNEKIELKQRLARVLRVPSNKICADCPETRPTWISFIKPQQKFALGSKVLASFVCLECAGLHRKLGTHICVVRSISHDQFEEKDVEYAEHSGNEVVNEIFEGHLQKSTMDGINIKPVLGAEVARRERFIRQKYVDLYFYRKRAHYQHIADVNKLIASVRKPFKSAADKESPTKPNRKKLKKFFNDDPLSSSDRDALTYACSTTVGNTTATNTSRTRTLTDRDDSHRSETPLRRTPKRVSSRRRSSRNSRTPKNKKSLAEQEKLTDPMFGIPFGEGGEGRIGESSTPQEQANVRSDLQFQEPMIAPTTSRSNKKDRGRSDLSGMILVFDEDSLETMDNKKISNELDAYRRSEPAQQTIDVLKLQNNLLGGFTKKPLMKTTSDERDKRGVTTSPRAVGRSRSEITMDQITRKHDGSLQIHLEAEKERQKNQRAAEHPEVEKTPLIAHLTKDPSGVQNTSTRKLNIPYLNSIPVSPTSVEGIISEETSYGFGDHTINGMSGTGETNAASVVEASICTVNGFRVIDITKPDSQESFTEQYQNKKEADKLIKSKSQRSLVHSHEVDGCYDEVDIRKERSTRSIGEEPTSRIYLERQNSQGSFDVNPPQSKQRRSRRSLTDKSKSKSSRSLTNKSRSRSNRSRSLTNKSKSSMSIDEPTARRKLRRVKKERDPSSPKKTKKKEKSRSRSLTNSPSTKKKVKSVRSLTNSPSKKKKKKIGKESLRSLTDSPSKKKKEKSRSRSLTNSPSTRKKAKSIRSLTNSPSKKEKKKVKKDSRRSLTDSPPKRKKEKSIRSLSNKSSTSIGKEERALRKKLRKPRSKSKIDYAASPASTKDRTSKRRSTSRKKIRKSRSKSRGRNAAIIDRNRALLDEWERLRDENKREFETLRRENQRKFADFDRHFSQHISILC